MTQGVQLVKPTVVTPAMMKATNVPENDYAEWVSGATYGKDAYVIVAAAHKVYQSLQAGNVGKSPLTESLWWIEVGPTNRWKAFDLSNTTQTVSATDIYYEIKPGAVCNAICLLNISGAVSVRIRVTDPTYGLIYDTGVVSLISVPAESGWYAWFFGERTQQSQFIQLDLPSYPNATIRVDLNGAPQVGVLMLGQLKTIGKGVRYGARVGIKDYSRKSRNDYGDTILKQGAYAKRASFNIPIPNDDLDNAYAVLAGVRATACLWIGYEPFACTIVYGFYTEFEIAIPYPTESDCTLDIEGLT